MISVYLLLDLALLISSAVQDRLWWLLVPWLLGVFRYRLFRLHLSIDCTSMLNLPAPVYFADPYSSWQKGGIENENGFIRHYIPKSTKMEDVSHQDVNRIMHKINRRPREKLNFATPIECFYEKLS